MKQILSEYQEGLIAALTGLLVENEKYVITFNTHQDTQSFLSMKKALVKDISTLLEKTEQGWPICYILSFSGTTFILNISSMKAYKLIPKGIKIIYPTYEVTCKLLTP